MEQGHIPFPFLFLSNPIRGRFAVTIEEQRTDVDPPNALCTWSGL
jgi:hypothetical protein